MVFEILGSYLLPILLAFCTVKCIRVSDYAEGFLMKAILISGGFSFAIIASIIMVFNFTFYIIFAVSFIIIANIEYISIDR